MFKVYCSGWSDMLAYCEDRIRDGFPDMREYMVTLRAMQRLGAKRGDDMPDGKEGDALLLDAINKSHAEWDDYVRVQQIFAPHIDQYRRTKYPNPRDDFHAAWVKAGEE